MTWTATTLKALLPKPLYTKARHAYRQVTSRLRLRLADWRIARAPDAPQWLHRHALELLQGQYEPRRDYGYHPEQLRQRGKDRAAEIMRLIPNPTSHDFLEIGAHDAMTGTALRQIGRDVTAVDLQDARDTRAIQAGVVSVEADAAELPLPSASFDVVYSYNTFEHIKEPDRALTEATRVLRPGGTLYLAFGPLYFSPFGLHAYYDITVPYCQLLFDTDTLDSFLKDHGRLPLRDPVNGWPVERYRELWKTADLTTLTYRELLDLSGLELIEQFPSCFKKAPSLDSLTVSRIEVMLRRNPA